MGGCLERLLKGNDFRGFFGKSAWGKVVCESCLGQGALKEASRERCFERCLERGGVLRKAGDVSEQEKATGRNHTKRLLMSDNRVSGINQGNGGA